MAVDQIAPLVHTKRFGELGEVAAVCWDSAAATSDRAMQTWLRYAWGHGVRQLCATA